MVKGEYGKLSKSQILKLSNNQNIMTVIAKFPLAFFVFINSSIC